MFQLSLNLLAGSGAPGDVPFRDRAGGRPGSAFGAREPPTAHFLCLHSLLLSLHDVYFTGQLFTVTNHHPMIELSSDYGNCQEARRKENVMRCLSEVRVGSLLWAPGHVGLWTRAQDTHGAPASGHTTAPAPLPPRPALLHLQL